jgi:hypothetical protein
MMSSFVAWLRLGNELSITHVRYRLEERPDHKCAIASARDLIDAPPSVSTEAWVRVRPSAWGFGPMNECQVRADQGSLVGLQPIENNGLEFATQFHCSRVRSLRLRGSLHVLTIRRYR